ncbi:S41 family peptidase [uncultured Winogradskyella sp.]|uniref:S41 family peptidase n=1 Tax=uncultured Winogradskyella sp. TaxID=395353 RepID=UPI00261F11BF|nr:S41 family peptidase [uncultured Winogradskyella sp.]
MKNLKKIKTLLIAFVVLSSTTSCFEDLDDNVSFSSTEVKDFVWKGMNAVYLYKSEIPDLANDRFNSNEEYSQYLNSFTSPETLFESLKYLPESVDRFSRIVDNYFDLQNQQQGVSLSNGIEFNFERVSEGSNELYCAITLVLNNSVASDLGLQRGQIFRAVDGINLNVNNAAALLSQDSYTLNFADYDDNGTPEIDDDIINLNGNSATLTREQYTENPVHIAQTITLEDNTKVGYLMYNQFNASFNNTLNNVFGDFQADGVSELVLDLRYNGGGSVQTAAYLGSMITGQYTGQVYSKLFYNENLQDNNEDFLFTTSIAGGGTINSLNLSRVYVLTTNLRTASASELVINSLNAYPIDVVVIGENTVGKTQASITIYDSPSLTLENVNPNHTYAMQPLVANSTNVNDELVPPTGLNPNIPLSETLYNLGTLGDINEPLLAAAIADIMGTGRMFYDTTSNLRFVKMEFHINSLDQNMYID